MMGRIFSHSEIDVGQYTCITQILKKEAIKNTLLG